jgi:hypothetical protein
VGRAGDDRQGGAGRRASGAGHEPTRPYWIIDGELKTFSSPHRYAWPAELDLMARIVGMTLRDRYGDWNRTAFTSACRSHTSVWQKPSGGLNM